MENHQKIYVFKSVLVKVNDLIMLQSQADGNLYNSI